MIQLTSLILVAMLAASAVPAGPARDEAAAGAAAATHRAITAPGEGEQGKPGPADDKAPPAQPPATPPAKLPAPKAPAKDKPADVSCKLLTEESPRGGQIDIQGDRFGQTPLVRIGERVARMISRTKTELSVQVHRDSDGGPVTVQVGKTRAVCGWLTIIGKD